MPTTDPMNRLITAVATMTDRVTDLTTAIGGMRQDVAEEKKLLQRVEPVPPPLKWAGIVAGAILSAGGAAMAIWLVASVSEMQVTLARMDERTQLQDKGQIDRFTEIERRISKLETFHQSGGK